MNKRDDTAKRRKLASGIEFCQREMLEEIAELKVCKPCNRRSIKRMIRYYETRIAVDTKELMSLAPDGADHNPNGPLTLGNRKADL